jgi:hypothetical protein
MTPWLILLLLGPAREVAQKGDAAQARLDSLTVYMSYRESIDVLKNATDQYTWFAYEDSLSRKVACALLRLRNYNNESYAPIDEYNREGMGVAYAYPQPTDGWLKDLRAQRLSHEAEVAGKAKAKAAAEALASEPKKEVGPVAFTVLDHQTHFLVTNNGKTKTPYIEMYYYAKGRVLVKVEKINPITLKPIELPEPEVKQTALVVSKD